MASVLACDLSQPGIRCIGAGHIDIDYECMLSTAQIRSDDAGKNVNEAGILLSDESGSSDDCYKQQILIHIDRPKICAKPAPASTSKITAPLKRT